MLKVNEIRAKDIETLKKDLFKEYKTRLFIKGQRALGNSKNVHEHKINKRNIARIKTIIQEKLIQSKGGK
ncbi:MAG: 50S ribosomal protein L29 [Pseudomonadota bacterium]